MKFSMMLWYIRRYIFICVQRLSFRLHHGAVFFFQIFFFLSLSASLSGEKPSTRARFSRSSPSCSHRDFITSAMTFSIISDVIFSFSPFCQSAPPASSLLQLDLPRRTSFLLSPSPLLPIPPSSGFSLRALCSSFTYDPSEAPDSCLLAETLTIRGE